ncbi:MAG: polysaccharide deacetylase family protein [Clostridium sp.]|nr:polysaccharide deacetylase family protein [Clostridium sp.]
MKNKTRYDRQKSAKIKKAKSAILFAAVALLVIGGGAVMAQRVFHYLETAQAEQIETSDEAVVNDDNSGNNENNAEINGDQDPYSEKPEFVQHYLDQQMRGEMPDGADGQKVVYLTFDDGPSETVTPQVLDTLKAENVHATFFVVGKYVDANEKGKELVKKAFDDGNAIAIHSYSHDYNYLYPGKSVNTDNFMADLEKTNDALKKALGDDFETKAIRLPGGHMTWKNTQALDAIFKEKGYSYIDWNSLSKDAEGPKKNADQLAQEAINTAGTKEKVVLLMHDTYGKEETAKSLPAIIKYFKDQGYQFKVIK